LSPALLEDFFRETIRPHSLNNFAQTIFSTG
jgi:hypothetical protein